MSGQPFYTEGVDIKCPHCGRDIEKMKPNVTKRGHRYFCKCGKEVTRNKLYQLAKHIKEIVH